MKKSNNSIISIIVVDILAIAFLLRVAAVDGWNKINIGVVINLTFALGIPSLYAITSYIKKIKTKFITRVEYIPTAENLELKCSKCASVVNSNSKFCSNCGMVLIPSGATVKCKNCGETLNIANRYCSKCAAEINNNNIEIINDMSLLVSPDKKYIKNEKSILKKMLKEEIKKQGESISLLSTKKINLKTNIALIILGIITLIIAFLYFFNYSVSLCIFIEAFIVILYFIITNHFGIVNTLTKKAINYPDIELSKIVTDAKNESSNNVIPHYLKLILVMFISIFIPCTIFFQPKVLYTKYNDGYQVFRYTKGILKGSDVITIKSTYKDKKVIAVGSSAFQNTNVKRVNLPEGIESIKAYAFYNNKNIESIEIPSTVTEIRGYAFALMTNLTHISLPEGLKEIRGGAFAYDTNLTSITLPNSLEYLGGSAFSHCSSITEITVPKGITEINGQTFEYMTSLRTINLHEGITSIHGETFVGDINLVNIKLPSKITEIKGSTFENCSSLTSIEIPDGVTRIGGHAFYGCSNLSYVYVPRTVVEIGSSAFRRCTSLNTITISTRTVVNERAFKESPTKIEYYETSQNYNR